MIGVGNYAVFELNHLIVTSNTPSLFMGFVVNFIIGCYVSSAFYLLFKKLGDDHIIIKCTIGSLILWFIFEVAFTCMIEDKYIPLRPVIDHYVHLIGTMSFGATVGWLLGYCYSKESGKTKSLPDHRNEPHAIFFHHSSANPSHIAFGIMPPEMPSSCMIHFASSRNSMQ